MCYHLLCQIQPYESHHFSISLTSVQLSTTQTPLHFKVKDDKHQILSSPLLHAYSLHFTPVPPNSLLAMSAYLHLPASLASILFPSVSLVFNFFLQCAQTSAPVFLTHVCQAASDAGLGQDGRTSVLASGLHISGTNWEIWPLFHISCFFLASSDPFLMVQFCLAVYSFAAHLLDT